MFWLAEYKTGILVSDEFSDSFCSRFLYHFFPSWEPSVLLCEHSRHRCWRLGFLTLLSTYNCSSDLINSPVVCRLSSSLFLHPLSHSIFNWLCPMVFVWRFPSPFTIDGLFFSHEVHRWLLRSAGFLSLVWDLDCRKQYIVRGRLLWFLKNFSIFL